MIFYFHKLTILTIVCYYSNQDQTLYEQIVQLSSDEYPQGL